MNAIEDNLMFDLNELLARLVVRHYGMVVYTSPLVGKPSGMSGKVYTTRGQ